MSAVMKDQQPKQMTDADLIAAIDDAESQSYGSLVSSLTTELSAQRALSIDLYLGRDVDPAPEGESSVIDRTVFETVQWILPSLCRIFANGEDVVTLDPMGEDDVEQAKQEAAYLNWKVTTKHPWFELFLEWATDALLTKNAYFLVYRDMRRMVEIEKYEGQTREGVSYLLQDKNVQLIQSRQYPAPDLPPEPVLGPDGQPQMQLVGVDPNGQPVYHPVLGPAILYDVVIRRTSDQKDLCIRVLPPERVKVDKNAYSWRVNESCNYFEYWEDVTLSSLRQQGFNLADDIDDDFEMDSQESLARDQFGENRLAVGSVDPSMRMVRARMIWIRVDADGDGIAELLQTIRVGNTLLYREEVSRIPSASGVACPLPHRHIGLSVADMVADLQRIKTAILRQGLNNLYLSNNPQKIVNESLVNIDDALVSRAGGLIRSTDINNGIRYEQAPFVFPQAVAGLQYMNEVAQNRTGVNNGFAGVDSSNLNDIQPGTVDQLSSMAAERVVQIARVLAFGIEDLFSIVHEQTLKIGHKSETMQLAGKWVEVDPGSWKRRTSFKIAVAFAAGNKDSQIGRLSAIAQKQEAALLAGINVVTPENYYNALTELTKATDVTSVDRYWTNPKLIPKPAPPPPEGIVTHHMDNQSKETIKEAELLQSERESLRKAELERYAIDSNRQLEIIHKRLDQAHTIELEGVKSKHAATLEGLTAYLGGLGKVDTDHTATSKAVGKAHDAIHQHSTTHAIEHVARPRAAKKVLRKNAKGEVDGIDEIDHDGKVIHSRTAIKDKHGRVIGLQ